MSKYNEEIKEKQQNIKDLELNIEELNFKNKKSIKEKEELMEKYSSSLKEIKDLQNELNSLSEKMINNKEDINNKEKSQINILENNNKILLNNINELEQKIDQQEKEKEAFKSEIKEISKTCGELIGYKNLFKTLKEKNIEQQKKLIDLVKTRENYINNNNEKDKKLDKIKKY